MRAERLFALLLIAPFLLCACERDAKMGMDAGTTEELSSSSATGEALLDFDIVQRTCALYVAVHSRAFNGAAAFGQEMDADEIHWNMCPGGTMVACVKTPTADGDTVVTGIPWPY